MTHYVEPQPRVVARDAVMSAAIASTLRLKELTDWAVP